MQVILYYQTPKGAGIGRVLPYNDAVIESALRSIRREARLANEAGDTIGGAEWCDGIHERGNGRPHWHWWFERRDAS